MKYPYSFCVLRYVHDSVTAEFVNVAVVLSCPGLRYLEGRFERRYGRLSGLFGHEIDGGHFRHMLRTIEVRLASVANRLLFGSRSALELSRSIFPLDDSALQFHEGGAGVTEDPKATLDHLYGRLVTHYLIPPARESRSDEEVLAALKQSLSEAEVWSELKPLRFQSKAFEHTFPMSWQNGRVNVCEPLSFDLLEADAIRNKAFRWAGRSKSIHQENPDLRLIFFLGRPHLNTQEKAFKDGRDILVEFVEGDALVLEEDQANHLVDQIRRDLLH